MTPRPDPHHPAHLPRQPVAELFPGRTEVPKTLVFAKDDNHAEEIVRIAREVFGKGDDFCQKITYRDAGGTPENLISAFRTSYNPRIAVTVDMIATGTDIKPLEALLFHARGRSRVLFEQMLGRGTRVITATDLSIVTPRRRAQESLRDRGRGRRDRDKFDPQTLERKRSVSFQQLLEAVAMGADDDDTLSSLAGRLAALDRKIDAKERYDIELLAGGKSLPEIANACWTPWTPTSMSRRRRPPRGKRRRSRRLSRRQPNAAMQEAACLLADNPRLRRALVEAHQRDVQIIDTVTQDVLKEAGFDASATESARSTVESFRQFLEANKDEITALQILYSRPYAQRSLTYRDIEELAA